MILRVLAVVLLVGLAAPSQTRENPPLRLFAAATLKLVLDQVIEKHEEKDDGRITVAYGPTPTLAKKIENGGAADRYMLTDDRWTDYPAEPFLGFPRSPEAAATLVRFGYEALR